MNNKSIISLFAMICKATGLDLPSVISIFGSLHNIDDKKIEELSDSIMKTLTDGK